MLEPDDPSRPNPVPADLTRESGSAPLRVCLITTEFHGLFKNGGIGTANTSLALSLAHAGFDVTVAFADADADGPRVEVGNFAELQKKYRQVGINLDYVPASPNISRPFDDSRSASYCVYLYLKLHAFDVVYFNDCGGHGYYALLAKRVGVFRNAPRMYVVTHGPHEWVLELNSIRYWDRRPVIAAYLERRCAALADALISPSQYMVDWLTSHGWEMPAKVRVVQNIVRLPDSVAHSARGSKAAAITEIVFFGRLEVRKGIELFCDTIDLLNDLTDLTGIRITFMGKFSVVAGLHSGMYIVERARRWRSSLRILARLGQEEALSYLARPGALAVIPSHEENSPCVVAECLQLGIPFVATGSGGTIELVAPEDRNLCLVEADPQVLAAKLEGVIKSGLRPARLAVSQADSLAQWLRLTKSGANGDGEDAFRPLVPAEEALRDDFAAPPLVSVCLAHANLSADPGALIASLLGQSYARLEFILCDGDGGGESAATALAALMPPGEHIPVRVLPRKPGDRAAARNAAAAEAQGEFLFFVDHDSVIPMPECIEALVAAALRTGACIVTSMPLQVLHGGRPDHAREGSLSYFPVGACAELGGFENCFGRGAFLVNRRSFKERGGFATPCDLEIEDWLFLATSVLSGLHLEVVPEPLCWETMGKDLGFARSKTIDNHRRILEAYSGQKIQMFKHVIESIVQADSAPGARQHGVLDGVSEGAREIALRVSSSYEPNSEDALRGFVQFCLESHRVAEALDFALYNERSLLSDAIGLAKTVAGALALDSVRRHTLDIWHEVALTDDARERVYSASAFPPRDLVRPRDGIATYSIETGVRVLKAAAVCPPGTRSVRAVAEVEGTGLPSVSLALVASTPNARLRLSGELLESNEAFWWSGWFPAGEKGGPLELPVQVREPVQDLLDLHFVCKTNEDGAEPTGKVTWKSVAATISVNGTTTASAIESAQLGTPIPRHVLDRGVLLTTHPDFPFPLFVPGDRTLLHPIPGRVALAGIPCAVPAGTGGIRAVVSLEREEAHPVQFAMWIRPAADPVASESEFTEKDAFSGWFSVRDTFRRHSFTLRLREQAGEAMDLYLATRVVEFPDVYYCHAVWHELLLLR